MRRAVELLQKKKMEKKKMPQQMEKMEKQITPALLRICHSSAHGAS